MVTYINYFLNQENTVLGGDNFDNFEEEEGDGGGWTYIPERSKKRQRLPKPAKCFDPKKKKTYTTKECAITTFLENKKLKEIQKIVKDTPELLPVCLNDNGTVNKDCSRILFQIFVRKDINTVANIIIDSDATGHIVDLHCESDPPKSKKELREVDKSIFDSSITSLDFRTDTTDKLLKTVVKLHTDCENDGVAGNGKVAFRHLKLYDKNSVFRLDQYQYDFQYKYNHALGKFSKQTQQSTSSECKESDFNLFYQSTIFAATGVQLVRVGEEEFVCKFKPFTLHPFDIGYATKSLDPNGWTMHPKSQDYFVENQTQT